jgi:hypothetical protein
LGLVSESDAKQWAPDQGAPRNSSLQQKTDITNMADRRFMALEFKMKGKDWCVDANTGHPIKLEIYTVVIDALLRISIS